MEDPNSSSRTTWEFKLVDGHPNTYSLIFSDQGGKKGSFEAHLVKLNKQLFLDVYPSELPWEPNGPNKVQWAYNTLFLIPAHTFIKVNSVEPQLKMQLTDDEKMKEFLKADSNAVKYTLLDDKPVLTASTKELQAFVLKYAEDDRVFTGEIVLNRKKSKD